MVKAVTNVNIMFQDVGSHVILQKNSHNYFISLIIYNSFPVYTAFFKCSVVQN